MPLSISFQEACRGGQRVLEFQDGRRLTVKIPEGVENGQKIKLSQQGDPGTGGAPNGDLYLIAEVQPHPIFTREGRDIVVKLPLTFSEAVLGGDVEVPTLDGRATVKVPKGVSSGQRLKLTGKGIRSLKGDERGDQFAEILIKIPRDPSAVYRQAAESIAGESFHPREGLF
jgi:DnaJ-class molecular chaperone